MGGTPSKPDIPAEIYNKEWCDVGLVVGEPTLRKNINKYVYPVSCPSDPSVSYTLTARQLNRYKYNPDKNIFRKIGKAALGAASAASAAASSASSSAATRAAARRERLAVARRNPQPQTARRSISNMFKGATGRGFYDQTLQLLISDYAALKIKRIKTEKAGGDISAIDAKIATKKAQMRNHIKNLKLTESDKAKLNDILNKVYTEDDATLENSLNTNNSNTNGANAISDISKILKNAVLAANTIFKSSDADVIAARNATEAAVVAAAAAVGPAHPAAIPIDTNVVIPKVKSVITGFQKLSPAKIAYAKQAVIQILSKIDKNLYQDLPDALRLSFPKCIDISKSLCKENTAERITWDIAQSLLKSGKSEKSEIDKKQADYDTAFKNQALVKSDEKKLADELQKLDDEIADLNIDFTNATADNTEAQTDLTAAKTAAAPRLPAPGGRVPAFALRNSGSAAIAELNRARDAASKAQKTLRDLTKVLAKANAKRALIAPGIATARAAVADADAEAAAAKAALDAAISASRTKPGTSDYRSAGAAAKTAATAADTARTAASASRAAFRDAALSMATTAVKYGIGVPVLAVGAVGVGAVYGVGHLAKGVGQGLYSGNASRARPTGNLKYAIAPPLAKGASTVGRVIGRGTRKAVGAVGNGLVSGFKYLRNAERQAHRLNTNAAAASAAPADVDVDDAEEAARAAAAPAFNRARALRNRPLP